MNETADTLESLRAEHRRNKLALAVERQRQKIRDLGGQAHAAAVGQRNALETAYYDPANFVDLTSYLGDGPFGYSLAWSPWLSTRADRDFGRDRPIFQTELDLAAFRGMARLLTAYNANAIGAVENLTSYVVGKGSVYKAVPCPAAGSDVSSVKPIVAAVQRVIDHFVEINDWDCDLAEEKFQRSRVDGEFFEGLWHVGGGEVHVRLVEPEQTTQPYTYREIEEWIGCDHRRVDWTFGVCADDEDAANVHGYYVQWTNRETDWDFLPGGSEPFYAAGSQNSWCQHFKSNVPRNVKRGVTDFICNRELFDLSRKVLQNMGKATSLASAIAWVIQHAPGILQSQIQSFIAQNADANYTQVTQNSTNTSYVKYYAGGTILHAPKGQEYKSAPGLENADAEINVVQAMLRSAAVRWAMPEHMISGDAGNNDYASILEAGSPFVKRCQRVQVKLAGHDRKVLWKVVQFAAEAGVIRDHQGRPLDLAAIKRLVEIHVEPCRVDVRNEAAETSRNETLKKNGVMSRKTWAAREGLDFEQEERNGLTDEAAPSASEPSAMPHTPHAGLERGSTESLDSLETEHAPAGEDTHLAGKTFKPGQFIPAADMAKATPAEKAKLTAQKAAAASGAEKKIAPATAVHLDSSRADALEAIPPAAVSALMRHRARLSRKEKDALAWYQFQAAPINGRLHEGVPLDQWPANVRENAETLAKAIHALPPLPAPITTWRGVSLDTSEKQAALLGQFRQAEKTGEPYTERAFVSSSLDPNEAKGFGGTPSGANREMLPIVLRVTANQGLYGDTDEHEFLQAPGTRYRVLKIDTSHPDYNVVHAEQV